MEDFYVVLPATRTNQIVQFEGVNVGQFLSHVVEIVTCRDLFFYQFVVKEPIIGRFCTVPQYNELTSLGTPVVTGQMGDRLTIQHGYRCQATGARRQQVLGCDPDHVLIA